jgi:uncharacterized protein (TIGR03067 family)
MSVRPEFRFIICIAMAMFACACDKKTRSPEPSDDPPLKFEPAPITELEGTWSIVESINRGEKVPEEEIKHTEIVINRNVIYMYEGRDEKQYSFSIDPATKPKSIDITHPKGTDVGIYALDRDKLKICVNQQQGGERPTEFASPLKSQLSLIILKRLKE